MTASATPRLRLVVMGTGPFAVPMFHAVLGSRHDVLAVVTRPAHAAPGRRPPPNPMRDAARAAGLQILDPERVNDPDAVAAIAAIAPDLLVVCDYGQILAPATLAVAPYGGINLHGSLLPRHRGAAPVQWAILAGDAVTGVSVIQMTPALDAGRVIVARETPIGLDETAAGLEQRLADIGAEAVPEAIDLLAAAGPGVAVGTPQDATLATKAPRLSKADGIVDWSLPAEQLARMRRALDPWPRLASFLSEGTGRPVTRIVLDEVAVGDAVATTPDTAAGAPGTILTADAAGIVVACGRGTRLIIRRLVPEGRKSMSAAEFLRGHGLFAAARFGGPA